MFVFQPPQNVGEHQQESSGEAGDRVARRLRSPVGFGSGMESVARRLGPARGQGRGGDAPTRPLCSVLRTANAHHWSVGVGLRRAPPGQRWGLGTMSPDTLGARRAGGQWVPRGASRQLCQHLGPSRSRERPLGVTAPGGGSKKQGLPPKGHSKPMPQWGPSSAEDPEEQAEGGPIPAAGRTESRIPRPGGD